MQPWPFDSFGMYVMRINDSAFAGIGAVAISAALLLGAWGKSQPPPTIKPSPCQAGYFQRDVRIYGQRLELGIDPKTHLSDVQTVTQNDPAADPPDRRYIVAQVCVRPLKNAENIELFLQGAN